MSWSPGTTVGDYRLLERLGAGGMGAVWRVEHRSTGARRALKATLFDDPEALERFQREAHALAALEHPNVARVHTAGEFEGRLYMVLDLAQGGDLEARLARGPLDPEAARALAIELARGLAHVHARGLLHRDLKPSNVLFDEHGRPLLADFGLARALDGSSLTQTGAVLGTPAYMAPEQARAGEPVDERADVYGLGAVLYHALTGAPPFRGGSPIGVLHAVLSQPPTSPRRLNPEVPADLERACLKALAKDPAERFPSARAFAAALRAPAPPGPERHVAVGFVVVALLSAGAAASLALRSPSSPREPAGRDVDALADPERALQPLGDRAKVPEAPDGFPRQVEAASLPHPLDRALARLEPPRPGEFDGCEDLLVQEFLAQLVEGTTGNAALRAGTWLEQQGRVERQVALLYHVARAHPDVASQEAWSELGQVLRHTSDRRALGWDAAQWRREGAEVVRECYRRAAQADRSGGMLALGVLYARSGTVLGMQIDPSEAARWFRAAIDARYFDPQDLISARVELAKLTSAHPGRPGVPSKEEALELLSYVLQVETNLGSYRYQEALRLRGLFQEAPPARD